MTVKKDHITHFEFLSTSRLENPNIIWEAVVGDIYRHSGDLLRLFMLLEREYDVKVYARYDWAEHRKFLFSSIDGKSPILDHMLEMTFLQVYHLIGIGEQNII